MKTASWMYGLACLFCIQSTGCVREAVSGLAVVPGPDPTTQHLTLTLNGEARRYALTADRDIIAADAKLIVQTGTGITTEPLDLRVFSRRSSAENVAVVVDGNNHVHRAIIADDQGMYDITPSAAGSGYTLTRTSNSARADAHCKAIEAPWRPPPSNIGNRAAAPTNPVAVSPGEVPATGPFPTQWVPCSPADPTPYRSNMGVAVDLGLYKRLGGNLAAVQAQVASLIFRANAAFFYQMNIVLTLKTLLVETETGGPAWNYDPAGATCPDINTALTQFTAWRSSVVPADLTLAQGQWQLLTACYPAPGTVGMSYIATLCFDQYGTGVSGDNDDEMWLTFVHEVGHNFGANHDLNGGGIMDYNAGGKTADGIIAFSPEHNGAEMCSQINTYLESGVATGCTEVYAPASTGSGSSTGGGEATTGTGTTTGSNATTSTTGAEGAATTTGSTTGAGSTTGDGAPPDDGTTTGAGQTPGGSGSSTTSGEEPTTGGGATATNASTTAGSSGTSNTSTTTGGASPADGSTATGGDSTTGSTTQASTTTTGGNPQGTAPGRKAVSSATGNTTPTGCSATQLGDATPLAALLALWRMRRHTEHASESYPKTNL